MLKTALSFTLAIAALAASGLPSAAGSCQSGVVRPYVIEKTCDGEGSSCKARLLYAPGQNSGLAGHGSYWYPRAVGYVRVSSSGHCGIYRPRGGHVGKGGDRYIDPQNPVYASP